MTSRFPADTPSWLARSRAWSSHRRGIGRPCRSQRSGRSCTSSPATAGNRADGFENKAGNGSDEGIYYEVGIAPSFTVGPVGVAVPITAGFGSNDFYGDINGNNEAFGYVSAGVNLSYTLPFIPECYGSWAINGAATYYYLGDALDDYNTAARGGSVRDGNHHEWVFSGGLVVTF